MDSMEASEAALLVSQTRFAQYAVNISPVVDGTFAYHNLFAGRSEDGCRIVLKVRSKGAAHVETALSYLPTMSDPKRLFERYEDAIVVGDKILLFTAWIDGEPMRDGHRDMLPDVFGQLAEVHLLNRKSGTVTAKYLDGKPFPTTTDLLQAEVEQMMPFLDLGDWRQPALLALEPLSQGFSTIVHGDVQPGNVMVDRNGKPTIIDCEWVHPGVNLYDLEYVSLFAADIDKAHWWTVHEEARDCYAAYFGTLGIAGQAANDQIRAFETLSALRMGSAIKFRGQQERYGETIPRLKKILETKDFI